MISSYNADIITTKDFIVYKVEAFMRDNNINEKSKANTYLLTKHLISQNKRTVR